MGMIDIFERKKREHTPPTAETFYDAESAFYRLNNVAEEYIIRLEKLKDAELKRIESRWDKWQE